MYLFPYVLFLGFHTSQDSGNFRLFPQRLEYTEEEPRLFHKDGKHFYFGKCRTRTDIPRKEPRDYARVRLSYFANSSEVNSNAVSFPLVGVGGIGPTILRLPKHSETLLIIPLYREHKNAVLPLHYTPKTNLLQ